MLTGCYLLKPLQAIRQREHSFHPGEDWRAEYRDAKVNALLVQDAVPHQSQALSDKLRHERAHDVACGSHSGYRIFLCLHGCALLWIGNIS